MAMARANQPSSEIPERSGFPAGSAGLGRITDFSMVYSPGMAQLGFQQWHPPWPSKSARRLICINIRIHLLTQPYKKIQVVVWSQIRQIWTKFGFDSPRSSKIHIELLHLMTQMNGSTSITVPDIPRLVFHVSGFLVSMPRASCLGPRLRGKGQLPQYHCCVQKMPGNLQFHRSTIKKMYIRI